MIQLMLVAVGVIMMAGLGYAAFAGPATGKTSARRLQQIRYRHSESAEAKVESQLKKAIAARKPKQHKVAGSSSRVEAIAMRLDRTGARLDAVPICLWVGRYRSCYRIADLPEKPVHFCLAWPWACARGPGYRIWSWAR